MSSLIKNSLSLKNDGGGAKGGCSTPPEAPGDVALQILVYSTLCTLTRDVYNI